MTPPLMTVEAFRLADVAMQPGDKPWTVLTESLGRGCCEEHLRDYLRSRGITDGYTVRHPGGLSKPGHVPTVRAGV